MTDEQQALYTFAVVMRDFSIFLMIAAVVVGVLGCWMLWPWGRR